MKIGVLEHSQKNLVPTRFASKNAAAALCRRLLAVRVSKTLIRLVEPRAMTKALPAQVQTRTWAPAEYQHHIEPRIEHFGFVDTEWMRYLNGY